MNNNFVTSWSGGKDSCFAMMQAISSGLAPKVLLNMMNENDQISRSHGLPKHILHKQAAALALPIITVPSSWNDYEVNFIKILTELKTTYQLCKAVFGDIDLQAHRDWEEKVCNAVSIEAVLPLWQQDRKELVNKMLHQGIETYIVSCNNKMGEQFLGKKLDSEVIVQLETIDIDVCGENGEFHTLVTNCPLFSTPINISFGNKKNHNDYWFIEVM